MADRAIVALGANLGDVVQALRQALVALHAAPGVTVRAVSPAYRTAPIDSHGPDYLNAVALVDTTLTPHALLQVLQEIERQHGRERPYVNAPRTLDLDLIDQAGQVLSDPVLVLPHPRAHQRAFVLRPLLDVWPQASLPTVGALSAHLAAVADQAIEVLPEPVWPPLGREGEGVRPRS